MTEPREVVVTDEEVEAFATMADLDVTPPLDGDIRAALAAFLARRIPDAKKVDFHKPGMAPLLKGGEWNACRWRVLKGV